MIKRIVEKVLVSIQDAGSAETETETGTPERDRAIRTATAILMAEVARADHVFEVAELERIAELIVLNFGLSPEDAGELVNLAVEKAEDFVHLHEFTQLLHKHLTEREKARVIELLWQVAYADGRLDMYEDSLVLKIGDLLYVKRARVMRLKHDAKVAAGA